MNLDEYSRKESVRGALAGGMAHFLWGLFPVFWKQLQGVDATELIAHRVVWSIVFVALLLSLVEGWGEVLKALRSARLVGVHLLSGGLLTLNWLVYVWAVNEGRVVETSLGYFLVPLINVALGKMVLKERLRTLQWVAIGTAAIGVAVQCLGLGHFPWIAVTLALSFGFYGLLRKRSPLSSLGGLSLETALYTPLAGAFLLWRAVDGTGALGHVEVWKQMMILSAGVVTAIPLILFAYGARRLRLSTLGLLQYIGPSMAFTLGTLVYGEQVEPLRMASFILIWVALAVYTTDNIRAFSRGSPAH